MNRSGPPVGNLRSNPLLGPLVAINVGILVVLLFGANGPHPSLPIAVAGAAFVLGGAALLVRVLLRQRRPGSTGKR